MWITGIIVLLIVFIDQLSKWLVRVNLSTKDTIVLIDNILEIQHVENRGMAGGLFDDSTIVLAIISLIATAGLIYFCAKYNNFHKDKMTTLRSVALSFALAGTAGNLFDRTIASISPLAEKISNQIGYSTVGVVDMIHCPIFPMFGVFNIADFFLVTAMCLLFLYFILEAIFDFKRDKNERV